MSGIEVVERGCIYMHARCSGHERSNISEQRRFRDLDADAEEPSGGAEVRLTLHVLAASTDDGGTNGHDDTDTNDGEADGDIAMTEHDDGSDAFDRDSDVSNDEDGWGSDDDDCSNVGYE